MKSHKAELVRLFILVNLLVMALFTIPAHAPEHNSAQLEDQHVQQSFVVVTDTQTVSQSQHDF